MIVSVFNFVFSAIAIVAAFGAPIAGCLYLGDGVAKHGRPADYAKIGCGILFFAVAGIAALYLSGAIIVFK